MTEEEPRSVQEELTSKKIPKWYLKTLKEAKREVFKHRTRSQRPQALIYSIEPNMFEEANQHLMWGMTMDAEIEVITRNETWELVEP